MSDSHFVEWLKTHQIPALGLGAIAFLGLTRFSTECYDEVYHPIFEKHVRRSTVKVKPDEQAVLEKNTEPKDEAEDEQRYHLTSIGKAFLWSLFKFALLVLIIYLIATYVFGLDASSSLLLQQQSNSSGAGGSTSAFKLSDSNSGFKMHPMFEKDSQWTTAVK